MQTLTPRNIVHIQSGTAHWAIDPRYTIDTTTNPITIAENDYASIYPSNLYIGALTGGDIPNLASVLDRFVHPKDSRQYDVTIYRIDSDKPQFYVITHDKTYLAIIENGVLKEVTTDVKLAERETYYKDSTEVWSLFRARHMVDKAAQPNLFNDSVLMTVKYPETIMSISQQQWFINHVVELANDYPTTPIQVLLSTHSPIIVSDLEPSVIKRVQETSYNLELHDVTKSLAASLDDIYADAIGTRSTVGDVAKRIFNQQIEAEYGPYPIHEANEVARALGNIKSTLSIAISRAKSVDESAQRMVPEFIDSIQEQLTDIQQQISPTIKAYCPELTDQLQQGISDGDDVIHAYMTDEMKQAIAKMRRLVDGVSLVIHEINR